MKKGLLCLIFLGSALFFNFAWAEDKLDQYATEKEKVKAALSAKKSDLRKCYNQLVEKKKMNEGKMVVDIEVDDQGQLLKSELNDKKSKVKDTELFSCVKDVFAKTYFPQSPKGVTISLSYPIMFKKIK